jgi:hypothetical protein
MTQHTRHPASFRDPSGFVFRSDNKIYRHVNKFYTDDYDHLVSSGLMDELISKKYLLPHGELKENITGDKEWYITLLPEPLTFISYPYEWCFEQLKDAALLTLSIVKSSVEKGMILKDATPLNIQFHNSKPVFIDTLSFQKYDESIPWIAYRQFCETFLFPLWLSHYHKLNFQNLLSVYPDGIPASHAAKLLPAKSRMNAAVWLHVHLPNKISKKKNLSRSIHSFSKKKLLNLINHLEGIIYNLENKSETTWSNYYSEGISDQAYLQEKEKIVNEMLSQINGKAVLDIGANDGRFSFLAGNKGFAVIAIDNDEQCINHLYKKIKKTDATGITPLCIDITNPSPATGFNNEERASFIERIKPDVIMALALIHHLVIGKNIPLPVLAEFFHQYTTQLIIEFIPKEDEKTKLLLYNKKDIYTVYSKEGFELCFERFFTIVASKQVPGSERFIYLMNKK